MAQVIIEGVFMGADVKTTNYEGKERSAVYVDVYQPESELTDKVVQLKADDVSIINNLNKEYAMGSVFKAKATVNAYKNKAYYKLVKVVN